MRLDKYLCSCTDLTRSMAKKLLHKGEVQCDGEVVKDPGFKVTDDTQVVLEGVPLGPVATRYIMLHKPAEFLCSNVDELYPSVLNLIELPKREALRIAGRLDVDTTGLVLLSEDGQWCHQITSPRRQCSKRYRAWLAEPLVADAEQQLAQGVQLNNEEGLTRPAELVRISDTEVLLTIEEGKYHQVKRMFAALGNKVVALHREAIGAIELDETLEPGEWRLLSEDEAQSVYGD
ncbi:pseudouridine synthase [Ferrimonas balearica]|uniref:pseudouridine synthase n=1 Tax=Ferrimonas balearica TaxID=44012 RepID=UPI001C93FEEB|nr:pseudouridine synthase [Ferrimonas balearica]MBY6224305.1 pseudouridine synthase [Ferrimonas balearica]